MRLAEVRIVAQGGGELSEGPFVLAALQMAESACHAGRRRRGIGDGANPADDRRACLFQPGGQFRLMAIQKASQLAAVLEVHLRVVLQETEGDALRGRQGVFQSVAKKGRRQHHQKGTATMPAQFQNRPQLAVPLVLQFFAQALRIRATPSPANRRPRRRDSARRIGESPLPVRIRSRSNSPIRGRHGAAREQRTLASGPSRSNESSETASSRERNGCNSDSPFSAWTWGMRSVKCSRARMISTHNQVRLKAERRAPATIFGVQWLNRSSVEAPRSCEATKCGA